VDKGSLYDICLCPCAHLLVGAGSCEFSLVIRYRASSHRAGALDGKPFSNQYDGGWRVAAGAGLEPGLFLRLIAGFDVIGLNGTGYMFGSRYTPLFKFFSLFHVMLPVLLLWMIYRLGYDTRAVYAQTLLIWILLPVCYLATDPERNLNWVFGIGNPPQTWVSGPLYVVLLMCAYPLIVFFPTHFILKSVFNGR